MEPQNKSLAEGGFDPPYLTYRVSVLAIGRLGRMRQLLLAGDPPRSRPLE